jgi:hypothetical protein
MRAVILILAAVVALGLIGAGNKCYLAGSGSCGCLQKVTEIDGVNDIGMENIRVVNVAPKQNYSLVFGGLFHLFLRDRNGLNLIGCIRSNNGIRWFDLIPRLGEILAIRNISGEEMDRTPSNKTSGTCTAVILEIAHECVVSWLAVLVAGNEDLAASELDDRTQLFASINLSVVGDLPLLVNEEKPRGVGQKQQRGEPTHDASPFDHLAIKVLGVLLLLIGGGLGWWSICHDIPRLKPAPWPVTVFGLICSAALIVSGLNLLQYYLFEF